MKKVLALLLAIAMLAALCACGEKSSDKGSSDKGSSDKGSSSSAEGVAESYVKADLEGDIETHFKLMLGDYQTYFEEELYGDEEDQEDLFELLEKQAEEYDVDVDVDDWDSYYDATKKVTKAANEDSLGDGYSITYRVVDTEKMRNSKLEDIQDMYDNDKMEDYIDVDLIEEGKKVYIRVFIDSDTEPEAYILTVYVVKYDGKWKVADRSFDDRDDD